MLPNPADLLASLLSLPQSLAGAFGVSSALSPLPFTQRPSGLGYQSVTVGAGTYERVRVTWNGLITNTGNAPLSGATVWLRAQSSPGGATIRETRAVLPTLAPGAAAPVSLAVDLSSSDPAGDFIGALVVELAGSRLGQVTSAILGNIQPTPPTPPPRLFAVGDRVEAFHASLNQWLPGTVTALGPYDDRAGWIYELLLDNGNVLGFAEFGLRRA